MMRRRSGVLGAIRLAGGRERGLFDAESSASSSKSEASSEFSIPVLNFWKNAPGTSGSRRNIVEEDEEDEEEEGDLAFGARRRREPSPPPSKRQKVARESETFEKNTSTKTKQVGSLRSGPETRQLATSVFDSGRVDTKDVLTREEDKRIFDDLMSIVPEQGTRSFNVAMRMFVALIHSKTRLKYVDLVTSLVSREFLEGLDPLAEEDSAFAQRRRRSVRLTWLRDLLYEKIQDNPAPRRAGGRGPRFLQDALSRARGSSSDAGKPQRDIGFHIRLGDDVHSACQSVISDMIFYNIVLTEANVELLINRNDTLRKCAHDFFDIPYEEPLTRDEYSQFLYVPFISVHRSRVPFANAVAATLNETRNIISTKDVMYAAQQSVDAQRSSETLFSLKPFSVDEDGNIFDRNFAVRENRLHIAKENGITPFALLTAMKLSRDNLYDTVLFSGPSSGARKPVSEILRIVTGDRYFQATYDDISAVERAMQ